MAADVGSLNRYSKKFKGATSTPFDFCYTELANAIIHQAVIDYCKLKQGRHPLHDPRKKDYIEYDLESFFKSKWFAELTDINWEWLEKRLKDVDYKPEGMYKQAV